MDSFLLSGFDLVEVGKNEVTVKAGKQANRRTLQFAVQALVAIFGTLITFQDFLSGSHRVVLPGQTLIDVTVLYFWQTPKRPPGPCC